MAQPINKDINAVLNKDELNTFENKNIIILENKFDILMENEFNEINDIDCDNLNLIFEDNFDIFINQIIDRDEDENVFTDSYFIRLSYFFLDYNFEICTISVYCHSDLFFTYQLDFSKKIFFFNLFSKKLQTNEYLVYTTNKVFNILYF